MLQPGEGKRRWQSKQLPVKDPCPADKVRLYLQDKAGISILILSCVWRSSQVLRFFTRKRSCQTTLVSFLEGAVDRRKSDTSPKLGERSFSTLCRLSQPFHVFCILSTFCWLQRLHQYILPLVPCRNDHASGFTVNLCLLAFTRRQKTGKL